MIEAESNSKSRMDVEWLLHLTIFLCGLFVLTMCFAFAGQYDIDLGHIKSISLGCASPSSNEQVI